MTRAPLVSIHIITYNQEALVDETLESALLQRYTPLEIVVADDGSKDRTLEILEGYQRRNPDRVRVMGGDNLGITGNSNRALTACKGELIAFQGGDDLLLPGKIQAQVDWMQGDARRVLCGHDVEHFSSESGSKLTLQSELTRLRCGVGPADFIKHGSPFAATSVMVRRSAIPRYGFDERLFSVSDGKLWIDCLMAGGHYGYVNGVYARYRRHAASVTRADKPAVLAEEFQVLDLVETEHPELAETCRRGRARLHRREGIGALMSDNVEHARRELYRSLKLAPTASAKAPIWLGLSYIPIQARRELSRALRGVGSLRSRLLHRRERARG